MNKKLIAPIVTAGAMLAMSIGSTFALFSSKASSRVDIEAGKVQVDLAHTIDWAVSHYEKGEDAFDAVAAAEETDFDALFENGNTAVISSSEVESAIELDRFAPLDQIAVNMKATNSSNINIKWRYYLELSGHVIPALDIKVDGQDYSTTETYAKVYGFWSSVVEPSETELMDLNVVVTFPDHGEDDNQYQEKLGLIKFGIEAVQGNAEVRDEVCVARSAEDLMEYSMLWNLGEEDRPLALGADIDLTGETWSPIGTWQNPFNGEISGNGHKIIGLSNNGKTVEEIDLETFTATTTGTYGAAYGLVGVAGAKEEGKDLVIKDIIFENLDVNLTDGNCVGAAIGYAPETGDFSDPKKGGGLGAGNFSLNNVEIDNVDATGNMIGLDCASGIMGKAYNSGSLVIKNCDTDVLVESTGGRAAGIVGYASLPSSYNIKNNSVANDVKATKNAVDGVAIGTNVGSEYVIDNNEFTGDLYWKGALVAEETERSITYVYENGVCKSVILTQPSNKDWEQKTVVAIGSNVLITDKFYAKDSLPINGDNVKINDCVVTGGGFTIYGNVTTTNSDFSAITPIVGHKTGPAATFTVFSGTFNYLQVYINSTLNIYGGTFNGTSKVIRVRNESNLNLPFHINVGGGKYKVSNPISVDAAAAGLEDINYIDGHISSTIDEDGYYHFIND